MTDDCRGDLVSDVADVAGSPSPDAEAVGEARGRGGDRGGTVADAGGLGLLERGPQHRHKRRAQRRGARDAEKEPKVTKSYLAAGEIHLPTTMNLYNTHTGYIIRKFSSPFNNIKLHV